MVLITLDINGLYFTGDVTFGSGRDPCFSGDLRNDEEGGYAEIRAERFDANNVQGYISSKDGYSGGFWGTIQRNPSSPNEV
jgi:hypothetical protein